MKTSVKVAIITIVLGVVAFLLEPNSPLGAFWAPPADSPQPAGIQLPLFIILGLAEGLAFGLGVSFLLFGYRWVRSVTSTSRTLTWAAFLSIAWLLINWFPHDSLHIHNGMALSGLLVIEYGFHITLMIAGIIMAYFFLTILRQSGALADAGRTQAA